MLKIIVVGSSNTDMVIKAKYIPAPGETILGGDFFMNPGGKGANQAVAVARLGGNITFISKIGKDAFGQQTLKGLQKEGINTAFIAIDDSMPSGVALITINNNAENAIVVAPGANSTLNKTDINRAMHLIEAADIILLQLEIPIKIVEYVAKLGAQLGKKVILNPAPAQELSDEVYRKLYAITPNETEAEILTGVKVIDELTATKAAQILRAKGVQLVIITMGAKGAFVESDTYSKTVHVQEVIAMDTTAAGDTFNGALAVGLSNNLDIESAVIFANKAAAITVTRLGAQSAIPYLSELKLGHDHGIESII